MVLLEFQNSDTKILGVSIIFYNPYIYIYIYKYESKVGERSRGRLEGSLFNSYYTKI